MKQNDKSLRVKSGVQHIIATPDDEGQRIDNFLMHRLKGMPKSRIYRILRKGEVRVNKKRIDASYRLNKGDDIRVPPVILDEKAKQIPPSKQTEATLASRIIYEDENLLIINKP